MIKNSKLINILLYNPFVKKEIQREIVICPQTNEKKNISMKDYGEIFSKEKNELLMTSSLKKIRANELCANF